MNKKLSIITINYNNLEGLKRTVESVVNQTWQEFEYIVIDGGSTDGSAEYIESHKDKFDYWISENDSGIYNAMNKGIAKATGEYLLFLNSGDHFFNDCVLEQNHTFLKEYELLYFNLQMIKGEVITITDYPENLRFSDLYTNSLPHPATFILRKLFDKVGLFDEKLKIVADWKFFILALFRDNCSYLKINRTMSTFYRDGISSEVDCSSEGIQVIKEYFNGFSLDCKELLLNRELVNTNRFKMLQEIEKSRTGMKIVSAFFRIYIYLFSKNKLKDVLK